MHARADTGARLAALALAWIAGVAWHLQQRELGSETASWVQVLFGALGLLAAWRWRRAFVIGLAGAALLAIGASGLQASSRLADALPDALEGRDLRVTGIVATLPQRSVSGVRFRLEVDAATLDGQPVRMPRVLAVGWYRGLHEDAARNQPQSELRAGQRWRFTLRLRQPHGNLNPFGFDYELLLFEQGIRATASVRDAPTPELLDRGAGFAVERLRQRVRDAIEASVSDRRAAGVLAALAVGDQGAIERDDWDLYRNTGIAHLVSISGLHITMFAWLAGGLIARLWRRSGRAALRLPTPLAARWGGLACAAAYAVFSGWGVPSQRTVWMLAVVTLAQTVGVRWPWLLVLLLAGVVVTALDPWALMQAGFWLSFVAVGLLMASSSRSPDAATGISTRRPDDETEAAARSLDGATSSSAATGWRRWPRRLGTVLRDDLRTQVIATIGLTPLTLVFFQQVSVIGFAANLISIPLITLVITPLALLGVAIVPLWTLGAWFVQRLNAALGWLASWPGAVWLVPVAPGWAQAAGLAGAVLLVLPLPWRARLLALPLLLPLTMPARDAPPDGSFELIALDVGQGTSDLVRTHRHLLVFDTGPQYSRESDAGQRVLLPLLRARGDERIDRLVLSHRDLDHVGGAASLLKAMPVGALLSSLEAGHPLLSLAHPTVRCEAGQQWDWDGVHFEMLRPFADDYARALKSNAMSCVLRVSAGGRSALLTGDIEREQEAALVATAAGALRSDVLVVPHHGSKTSSSGPFLDAVAPRIAVVQSGYRNRFGHPAPEVVQRYRERRIETAASPSCGAWQWRSEGSAPAVCYRETARRYWHHRAD